MSLLGGLLKIATAPLRGAVKIVSDVSGKSGEEDQLLSIATMGLSSIIKGTVEGIEDGIDSLDE